MADAHPNDPLHGMTLKAILEDLVERRGWPNLAEHIRIRCFEHEPSVGSSLKFLRRTPWARAQVERLYVDDQRAIQTYRDRDRGTLDDAPGA